MIEYEVIVHDDLTGTPHSLGIFAGVEVAVYNAKKITENLSAVVVHDLGLTDIHDYHLKHPHKRFDVVVEVVYE